MTHASNISLVHLWEHCASLTSYRKVASESCFLIFCQSNNKIDHVVDNNVLYPGGMYGSPPLLQFSGVAQIKLGGHMPSHSFELRVLAELNRHLVKIIVDCINKNSLHSYLQIRKLVF